MQRDRYHVYGLLTPNNARLARGAMRHAKLAPEQPHTTTNIPIRNTAAAKEQSRPAAAGHVSCKTVQHTYPHPSNIPAQDRRTRLLCMCTFVAPIEPSHNLLEAELKAGHAKQLHAIASVHTGTSSGQGSDITATINQAYQPGPGLQYCNT